MALRFLSKPVKQVKAKQPVDRQRPTMAYVYKHGIVFTGATAKGMGLKNTKAVSIAIEDTDNSIILFPRIPRDKGYNVSIFKAKGATTETHLIPLTREIRENNLVGKYNFAPYTEDGYKGVKLTKVE